MKYNMNVAFGNAFVLYWYEDVNKLKIKLSKMHFYFLHLETYLRNAFPRCVDLMEHIPCT